jgi:hypothetical protein
MAIKPTTGIEDHPVGTAGLNGIINGNWERLEEIFLPLKDKTSDLQINWDTAGQKFIVREAQTAPAFSATPVVDFTGACNVLLDVSADITGVTTSNRLAGRSARVIMMATGATRALAGFPGGWIWIGGTAPTSLTIAKTALLELYCTSTTDGGVIARWTVEP